jgi:hypothetical protein
MKRHAFDPFPFVLGGLLLTLAVLGVLDAATLAQVRLGVLVPAVLVTLGAALLLGSTVTRPDRADGPTPSGPPPPPEAFTPPR